MGINGDCRHARERDQVRVFRHDNVWGDFSTAHSDARVQLTSHLSLSHKLPSSLVRFRILFTRAPTHFTPSTARHLTSDDTGYEGLLRHTLATTRISSIKPQWYVRSDCIHPHSPRSYIPVTCTVGGRVFSRQPPCILCATWGNTVDGASRLFNLQPRAKLELAPDHSAIDMATWSQVQDRARACGTQRNADIALFGATTPLQNNHTMSIYSFPTKTFDRATVLRLASKAAPLFGVGVGTYRV